MGSAFVARYFSRTEQTDPVRGYQEYLSAGAATGGLSSWRTNTLTSLRHWLWGRYFGIRPKPARRVSPKLPDAQR